MSAQICLHFRCSTGAPRVCLVGISNVDHGVVHGDSFSAALEMQRSAHGQEPVGACQSSISYVAQQSGRVASSRDEEEV